MMRLRATVLLAVFWSVLVCAASAQEAEEQDRYVIGKASVTGGNQAAARKQAIDAALLKGVEAAVAERMVSAELAAGLERVAKDVLPRSADLVQGYTILQEAASDGSLLVLVKLRVNGAMLEKALQDSGLAREADAPVKILFMVSEKRDGEPVYWWKDPQAQPALDTTEILLHQTFQDLGYDPVNRVTAFPGKEVASSMRALDLQEEDIFRWGALFGAEWVLWGRSGIQSEGQVSLDLKILEVASRRVLAESRVVERPPETAEADQTDLAALDKAVQTAAAELQQRLSADSQSGPAGVKALEVFLQGFRSYEEVNRFQSFIASGVAGVQSIKPSRAGRDSVGYQVLFRGDAAQLLSIVNQSPNRPFAMSGEIRSDGALVFSISPSSY